MDRRFRTRLAVEQFLGVHYAQRCGYRDVPSYHNDCREPVLQSHRRFLARHFIVLDPWDIGLRFPKYEWAYRSSFQQLNCLLFVDWYRLYLDEGGAPLDNAVFARRQWARRIQKGIARRMGRALDHAGPWLLKPGLKRLVNQALTALTWQSRPLPPASLVPDAMPPERSYSSVLQGPLQQHSPLSRTPSSE
jgi:hypothetical protein